MSPDWFIEWFNEDYLLLYNYRDEQNGAQEVAFIADQAPPSGCTQVLDLACGAGRHTRQLSRFYPAVIGLDLSETMLRKASENDCAGERLNRTRPNYLRADMRDLPFADQSFQLITSLFNSFGYFSEHSDHLRALNEIARVLTPGGKLFFDFFNRQQVIDNLIASSVEKRAERIFEITRTISASGDSVIKEIHAFGGGVVDRHYREQVHLFSPKQLEELLSEVGLTVDSRFGDLSGAPFTESSPQLIYLARKSNDRAV